MKRLMGTLVGVISLGLGLAALTPLLYGHGGDTSLIHACVNNKKGSLRIITANGICKTNETALDWSITGPQGPSGPAGPTGATGPTGPQGPSDLFKFVGFCTGTINGGQGMLQMHALCQVDYGASARMCTSKEFWLSPNATAPTTVPAWLHPTLVVGNLDFSGLSAPSSCYAWNTTGTSGLVVSTNGTPDLSPCTLQRSVACCAP